MPRVTALFCLLAVPMCAQEQSVGSITQTGNCMAAEVQGNVTLNCTGLSPELTRLLTDQYNALHRSADEAREEANKWSERYFALSSRVADSGATGTVRKRIDEAIKSGKLDEASRLLDELLLSDDSEVDRIARDQFNAGTVYDLRFQPSEALPHYEKAWRYQPSNVEYGHDYGELLYRQRDYRNAERVLNQVVLVGERATEDSQLQETAQAFEILGVIYSDTHRASESSDAYRHGLQVVEKIKDRHLLLTIKARMLNHIGVLDWRGGRLDDAIVTYRNVVAVFEELSVTTSMGAYVPTIAAVMNNLGIVYQSAGQFDKALTEHTNALLIRRDIARRYPQEYMAEVAESLNNRGMVYRDMKRLKEAEVDLEEARQIRTQLASMNPQAYLPTLANTLNNLGMAEKDDQQIGAAEEHLLAALDLREHFVKDQPELYRGEVSKTILVLVALYHDSNQVSKTKGLCRKAMELRQFADAEVRRETESFCQVN
jgi:tetratricopeptide (TPR) repeat protein